ncbi:MAG: O-antigen ligase family protein [Pseudanabaenaceae cyanobacterium]
MLKLLTDTHALKWEWYLLQLLCLLLPLNNVFSSLLGLILVILCISRHGWRCLDNFLNRGWLLFALWLGISVFTAYSVGDALFGLLNFYPFLLLFAIATYLLETTAQAVHLLWLILLGSLPLSLFGFAQVLINRPDWKLPRLFNSYEIILGFGEENRIASLFGHTNELALFCLMLLPVAAHFSLGRFKLDPRDRYIRITATVILGALIAMLVFAQSRNVWALGFIGLIIQSIFYSHWWLVAILVTVVPTALWLASQSGIGRTSWEMFLNSNEIRVIIWSFCVNLIAQRPILGWGLRNFIPLREQFKSVYPIYDYVVHEHNFFLAIALGSGVPALILFIVLIVWMIAHSWRSKNVVSIIASFSLILFLLSGIYDTSHYEPRVFILFWLMAAVMQAEANRVAKDAKINSC